METIYIVLCIVGVVLLGLIVWKVFFPAKDDTPAINIVKKVDKTLLSMAEAAAAASTPSTQKFENTDCSNYIPISKKNIEDNKYCFFKYIGNNIYLLPALTDLYEQLYNNYIIDGDLQQNITNLEAHRIGDILDHTILIYVIINIPIIEYIKSIYLSGLVLFLQILSYLKEEDRDGNNNVNGPKTVILRYYETSKDIPSGAEDVKPNTLYLKYFDGIIADKKERDNKMNSINDLNTIENTYGMMGPDKEMGIRINLDTMFENMKTFYDDIGVSKINTNLMNVSKEVKDELIKLQIMYTLILSNNAESKFYNFKLNDLDNSIQKTKGTIQRLDPSIEDNLLLHGFGIK